MTEPFRTNLASVPHVPGLREDEGWVDMRVQFLIDEATAGSSGFLLGRTIMPPGARHEKHAHDQADEFFVVLEGAGEVYTD
ncbi:MAG: cupin domain-containing protein, partial [Acidimicrobiia bacterium]